MKIVLAPDSFKGSLSAIEVCKALKRGVLKAVPSAEIVEIPLADGGEGTLDALLLATGGITKSTRVRGPLDEEIEARWAILPDGTALIEMAQSSGLTLTPPQNRQPLRASTWGLGQMIRAALDAGCRRFLIGLGGSATTDGGTGLLSALGARFFDTNHVVLPQGGGFLSNLTHIDLKFFDQRLQKCEFAALCDVSNPLCGPISAAQVFGPQKGASLAQVETLDAALSHLAVVAAQTLERDVQNEPGAGAAGGTGFALIAFLNAHRRAGIETVLEAANFSQHLDGAALVLTGEGALDVQTLSGKTIAGVCQMARRRGVPTIALGGRIALSGAQMDELGLQSAFSICDAPRDLEFCLSNAATLIEDTAERVLRAIR